MKKRIPKKEKSKTNEKQQPSKENEEQKKPFDFGGLPQRDLKKNLGCG
ncbi:MAG TPA: hypothetical protein VIM65_13400 [Cyclobacteriaceae bacterium]